MKEALRVAIVGAGWAGLAAAVRAVELGHAVTVFEAAREPGGRARGLPLALPDGRTVQVDNGQHVLIGAHTDCLRLMRVVGADPERLLLRLPLTLRHADGRGLQLPAGVPAPWDAALGIATARGWRWSERAALLREAVRWRRMRFSCDAPLSVAGLCAALPERVRSEFIGPLCVSALNTPPEMASAQVFLRVLHDSLFAARGGSNLLLPRASLSALFPEPAARWLAAQGAGVRTGRRVQAVRWLAPHWCVDDEPFDRVILATSAPHAALALASAGDSAPASIADALRRWCRHAAGLGHRAITTVYAQQREVDACAARPRLAAPMVALRDSPAEPAQFVFERDAIAPARPPTRLLAFVVSDSGASGDRAQLEAAVVRQAERQLGLAVTPLRTITEKRATFACTPALKRPASLIAPGLHACGDYVEGPYPATLEGAVRSGLAAAGAATA